MLEPGAAALAGPRGFRSGDEAEVGRCQRRGIEVRERDREGVGGVADHSVVAALLDVEVGELQSPFIVVTPIILVRAGDPPETLFLFDVIIDSLGCDRPDRRAQRERSIVSPTCNRLDEENDASQSGQTERKALLAAKRPSFHVR